MGRATLAKHATTRKAAGSFSMVPTVLRQDPTLATQPHIRQVMEGWWAGALWDPREPGVGDFTDDFTNVDSTAKVIDECHTQASRSEPLVAAVFARNVEAVETLLDAGANATHALHTALRGGADPALISLVASYSLDLDAWMPEPVVVAWARVVCDSFAKSVARRLRSGSSSATCHGADIERLDVLLAAGASVNAVGRGSEAALHVVARRLHQCSASATQEVAFLQSIWHNLVARGADSTLPNGDGCSPLEHLTIAQCTDLLASKRNQYSMRLYQDTLLLGEDPSAAWSCGMASAQRPGVCMRSYAKATSSTTSSTRTASTSCSTPRHVSSASSPMTTPRHVSARRGGSTALASPPPSFRSALPGTPPALPLRASSSSSSSGFVPATQELIRCGEVGGTLRRPSSARGGRICASDGVAGVSHLVAAPSPRTLSRPVPAPPSTVVAARRPWRPRQAKSGTPS